MITLRLAYRTISMAFEKNISFILCVGILSILASLMAFFMHSETSATIDQLKSLNSLEFKYSCVIGIAMCYPAVLQIVNDTWFFQLKAISIQSSISIFFVPLFHLVSCMVIFFILIPAGNYKAVVVIFLCRRICFYCVHFTNFSIVWSFDDAKTLPTICFCLSCFGILLEVVNTMTNILPFSFFLFRGVLDTTSRLLHFGIFAIWLHNTLSSKHTLSSSTSGHSAAASIDITLGLIIIIAMIGILKYYEFPNWNEGEGKHLAAINTAFSLYTVTVSVLCREALIIQVF